MWELDLDMKSGRICHLNNFNRRCKTNFSEVYCWYFWNRFVLFKNLVRRNTIYIAFQKGLSWITCTLANYLKVLTKRVHGLMDHEVNYINKILFLFPLLLFFLQCLLFCRWSPPPSGQVPPACADQTSWGWPCKVVINILWKILVGKISLNSINATTIITTNFRIMKLNNNYNRWEPSLVCLLHHLVLSFLYLPTSETHDQLLKV